MIRAALLLAALAAAPAAAETPEETAAERGRRLYETGAGLSATIAHGAPLPAPMAACARCHRPSGHGVSEGEARAPAIAGPALFAPLAPRRDLLLRDLYQERYGPVARLAAKTPRSRPAYDGAADLARALRDGIDPAGRPLSPAMPRYAIDDADAAALAAYLRRLGAAPEPGVDAEAIHVALILGPGLPAGRAAAILDVARAFVDRRNREIGRERARPGFSPLYKGEYAAARRLIRLHPWTLEGPAEGWAAQLAARQAARPVFAAIGGAVAGGFAPAQDFCEAQALPCLFPQTEWPEPAPGSSTLHLSAGLPGEARLILDDLARRGLSRVAQIVGAGADARRLAELTTAAPGLTVETRGAEGGPIAAEAVLLWLDAAEAEAALAAPALRAFAGPVYAAGGLLADGDARLALAPPRPVLVAWRFAAPGEEGAERMRARKWLRARRVDRDGHERAQLETLLAFEAFAHAATRLVDRWSRPFLIESVEHLIETGLNPGLYPRMSLGPGQRFAARGARLIRIGPEGG